MEQYRVFLRQVACILSACNSIVMPFKSLGRYCLSLRRAVLVSSCVFSKTWLPVAFVVQTCLDALLISK